MFDGLDGFDRANALYLAVLLLVVLIGSASLRRVGLGRGLKMAAAWVAIFGVLLVIATYRDEAGAIFARVAGEVDPAGGRVEGQAFHIKARSDGHYWVRATIDDQPLLFLIDTGASGIVLSGATADRLGVDRSRLVFDRVAQTANGPVRGASTRVAKLEVGPIVRTDIPVEITDGALDTNLLGMRFLNTLRSWRVEGDTLVMQP